MSLFGHKGGFKQPSISLLAKYCTVLTLLLLGLAGMVDQALVEEGAAGRLLEEVHDGVVHRVTVLVEPSTGFIMSSLMNNYSNTLIKFYYK